MHAKISKLAASIPKNTESRRQLFAAIRNPELVITHEGKRYRVRGNSARNHLNMSEEKINHPSHYNQGKIEAIVVIEDWKLSFCLGNCVKYISRAPYKGTQLEDLKKALWYLTREIETLEGTQSPSVPQPVFLSGFSVVKGDERRT